MTLRVEKLGFSYKTKDVFRDVSFGLSRGQILSLVGPNGAGKTTLLKCVNRLLPRRGGRVEIEGRDVTAFSRLELARAIAYVPQAVPTRFPISVFDAVMLGRKPYLNWTPSARDVDMVSNVIVRLELSDLVTRDVNQLSGGETQKVILAKAIVQEPQILLFDEPTTYLDLKYQLKIMGFIRSLIDERNIAAVVTTHDLNLALRFSDRLAVLKDGRLIAEGAPCILTESLVKDVYDVDASLIRHQGKPVLIPLRA